LKVAIADKTFFSNEEHDARLLLNTLARAGCQWDPQQGYDDETYQRIDRAVHAIIDDYDEDAALFSELLAEFESFFSDQRARAERVASGCAKPRRARPAPSRPPTRCAVTSTRAWPAARCRTWRCACCARAGSRCST
jgi:hypothetical protein